ncbi:MAG: hypothetical protein JXA57_10645, partial [Armatimonadetes bacterium]|nr:hypothetical protein [Armatimonadota bacterium]
EVVLGGEGGEFVILFKPEHKHPILDGEKYVTRRQWKRPRAKVGSWHKLYTRPAFVDPPGKPFARVQIVSVVKEPLGPGEHAPHGRHHEANAEGYADWHLFLRKYEEINGPGTLDEPCYRVEWDPETMEVLDG